MAETSNLSTTYIKELIDIQRLLEESKYPLTDIDQEIATGRFKEMIAEFNLAQKVRGRDFILRSRRFLVYQSSSQEIEGTNLLTKNNIPHLSVIRIVKPRAVPYTIIPLPHSAQPLSSRVWPDQQPTINFHGSFEVFSKLAEVLGRLYQQTRKMPDLEVTGLGNFAIVQGMVDLVRIAPPYNLVEVNNPEKFLEETFWKALDRLDPTQSHALQMTSFFTAFGRALVG